MRSTSCVVIIHKHTLVLLIIVTISVPSIPRCEGFHAVVGRSFCHPKSSSSCLRRTGRSTLLLASSSSSKKKRSNKKISSSSSKSQSSGLGFGISVTKSNGNHMLAYIPDTSPTITEFIRFLQDEECEGIDETCIGISSNNGLRGLYTKEAYEKDDYILAIPVVTALEISQTTQVGSIPELPNDVEKAVSYLQKIRQQSSDVYTKWERYINTLPTRDKNFAPTIDFWDPNDPSFIALQTLLPTIVEESIQRKIEVKELSMKHNIDYNVLLFTTWLLRSRIFTTIKKISSSSSSKQKQQQQLEITTPVERNESNDNNNNNNNDEITLHRTFLIPYMDMLNHAPSDQSNAAIHIIEGSNDDESMFCIQARKSIRIGQEIVITYGTGYESTFDVFTKYGFFIMDTSTKPNLIRYNSNDIDIIDWNSVLETGNGSWITQNTIEQDIELLQQYPEDDNNPKKQVLQLQIYLKQLYVKWEQQQQQKQQNDGDAASDNDNTNTNTNTIQIDL